jgi:hypothetical protein
MAALAATAQVFTDRKARPPPAPPMSAQATVKEHLPNRTGAWRSAYIEGLS